MRRIKVNSISGFPEYLPKEQIIFNEIASVIRKSFERIGAVPIETPVVEREEVLLSKGGINKQVYGIRRLVSNSDDEDKKLALRFDLTVPLARYVTQHRNDLVFPFRRYQIQPVWRGERAQTGRYKQFYQCDLDIIGEGSLSLMNDAEIPSIIYDIFNSLDIGDFKIHINNVKILNGLMEQIGIKEKSKVLTVIDKLDKVGVEEVNCSMRKLGLKTNQISILNSIFNSNQISNIKKIANLKSTATSELLQQGLDELEIVTNAIYRLGVPNDSLVVDFSIARGLDYYTGTVYETRLTANSNIGSICSGGRYDKLTSLFSNQSFPGVGISIGLSRLFAVLMNLGKINPTISTVADVLVTTMDDKYIYEYLDIAKTLREAGINTEVFLEKKKISKQLSFANRKGFKYAIIAGEEEFKKENLSIKDLVNRIEKKLTLTEFINQIKNKDLILT